MNQFFYLFQQFDTMDPYTPLIKQLGARPRGHCDVCLARIITDYRLSQTRSISANEMYSTI